MKTKLDKILIILLYIFVAFESQNLMAMNNANTNSIAKEAPAKVEMGDVTKQSKEYKAQRKQEKLNQAIEKRLNEFTEYKAKKQQKQLLAKIETTRIEKKKLLAIIEENIEAKLKDKHKADGKTQSALNIIEQELEALETDKSTIEKQLKALAKEENTLKEIFVEKDKRLEQITIAITKQVEQKMKERKKKALAAKIKAAKL